MDIGTIAPQEREVALVHPGTGEDLPMIFRLRSPHDKKVLEVQRNFQNARLRKRNMDITAEEFETVHIQTLTAHVVDWRFEDPELVLDGEQPKFAPAVCQKLLRNHAWIREWLDRETGNAARFYKGSETA